MGRHKSKHEKASPEALRDVAERAQRERVRELEPALALSREMRDPDFSTLAGISPTTAPAEILRLLAELRKGDRPLVDELRAVEEKRNEADHLLPFGSTARERLKVLEAERQALAASAGVESAVFRHFMVLGGHLKSGHRWTVQNRPPGEASETGDFYPAATS